MPPMDWKTVLAHAHPVVVHFPIACLNPRAAARVARAHPARAAYGNAFRALLWTGLVIGAVVIFSGLRLEDEGRADWTRSRLARPERHELAAFCTAGAASL